MDSNPSLGTGSTLLGGAAPAMNAMQSPGGISGMQTQMTPAAGGYNPSLQVPAQPPMPQGSPMSAMQSPQGFAQSAMPQQPTQGLQVKKPQTEAEILISALNGRLKSLSKMHESMVIPQQPQINTA